MIHNTGAYGPNETPINMGAPVNVTQLNVPMIPHNLNNLSKLPQQPPHPAPGSYNLPNYPSYGHQPVNMGPHMSPFPNYHSNLFQNSFMSSSASSMIDTGWQNAMLPMNLNVQNQQGLNFQNFDKMSNTELKSNETNTKVPLNIPQFPIQKQATAISNQFNSNFHQNESYNNNSKQNADHTVEAAPKQPDILEHDISRRKTLENTIKMIENILVNTTKNRELEMNRELDNKQRDVTENVKKSQEIDDAKHNTDVEPNNMCDDMPVSDNAASESEEDVKPMSLLEKALVSVKVEPLSVEVDNEFLRDPNGVSREELEDGEIVECDTSVAEASEAIKNGVISSAYYECPYCKLLLQQPKRFLIHTKWHTFGLTRTKRLEMARMKSERRMQLKEERDKQNSLQLSSEDVEKGKAFACKDCDKAFGSKSGLKNHRQRVHPTRSRECKICKKTVLGWMALRAHIAGHTGDAGFQCADCPKRFKYAHSLAKHRDTHLEKTHGCDQCSKMFGSQALLKMHMKTHARALRGATFHCTYCGKGFYEAWNLQVHERTHRNERPFLCEICNTAFGTNSSLKRHVKVSHSSSKPHECGTCHRCFMSAAILERHERRAHGDPEDFKFVCKQCPCRYLTPKDLQKHVYKVHPKGKRKRKSESDSE